MKKNFGLAAFLAAFMAICLVMSVGLAIAGPSGTGANERLSEFPQLMTEDGELNTEYLSEFADWVNDRFFLRQDLISLDRLLTGKIFQTSGESGVILGSNGWLYFTDTLGDYTGTEQLTDREIWGAANNLALMAEFCRENGKEFVFVIAPNKNSLYDANMPDYGVKAEENNASRLLALLETMDVTTVDLYDAFSRQEEVLYFAHDSHWNSKGAALGADRINAAFGVESNYFGGSFTQGDPHKGDLFVMMYPALTDTEQDLRYGGKLDFRFTGNATRPDAIVLNTESDAPGSLLAYRDSFGNLLFPYLASSFGTARFARTTTYDLTGDAESVLVELVERNIDYLLMNMPVMASPVRQVSIPSSTAGTIRVEVGSKGDFTRVTGLLPGCDDTSAVYVVSGGVAYEAFCLEDGGFGVNLPEGGEAELVICTENGADVAYKLEK